MFLLKLFVILDLWFPIIFKYIRARNCLILICLQSSTCFTSNFMVNLWRLISSFFFFSLSRVSFMINTHGYWQCFPYFDEIGCAHPGCVPSYPTPECERKCKVKNQLWAESKHYSASTYRISSNQHDIMAEVYTNGPVEVSFTVYEVN